MQNIKKNIALFCFVVIAVFAIVGRVWVASQKPLLEHDEAITLTAATGHQGEVARILSSQPPLGEVAQGHAWRRLLLPEDAFVFGRIASDLSRYDLHPPLYFWVLHLWVLAFGSSAFSGVMLNTIISVLIAITLFLIARGMFSLPLTYMMVLIWLLSPISLHSTIFIRQYHLLTLFGLIYAYLTFRIFYLPEQVHFHWKSSLLWLAIATLMMLIHSVAIFIIFASILTILVKAVFQDRKRIILLGGHLIFSAVGVLLIHSGYIGQFAKGRGTSPLDWERLDTVIALFLGFIVDLPYQRGIYAWVRPVMIIGLLVGIITPVLIQWYRLKAPHLKQIYTSVDVQSAVFWGIFFFSVFGGASALYVAGLSPIDYRYYTQALVFAVFLPAFLLKLPILNNFRQPLIVGIIAMMVLSAGLTFKQISENYAMLADSARYPDGSEFILVNISRNARGHLLQVAYNLPDEATVYVSLTRDLLDNPTTWLEQMSNADTTLLLGNPNNDLFALIENEGYSIEPYASYLYYTSTKRVYRE